MVKKRHHISFGINGVVKTGMHII